jgi:hypothetical protein
MVVLPADYTPPDSLANNMICAANSPCDVPVSWRFRGDRITVEDLCGLH